MKRLKPTTKLDGTLEDQLEASKRIMNLLSEEEQEESMSDKYKYLDEE